MSLGLLLVMIAAASPSGAQTAVHHAKKPASKSSSTTQKKSKGIPANQITDPAEKQLVQLSRALRDDGSATTYGALSAFATQNAKKEFGPRAALALAYYDLARDKSDLALGWLRNDVEDRLLREYVQCW
jgi:hypothetical protein